MYRIKQSWFSFVQVCTSNEYQHISIDVHKGNENLVGILVALLQSFVLKDSTLESEIADGIFYHNYSSRAHHYICHLN